MITTPRNNLRKNLPLFMRKPLEGQDDLSPRPDFITWVQTAAGEIEASWRSSLTPEQEAAQARLARLIISESSASLELGLRTLQKAQLSGDGAAQLETLCRELRCTYATLITEDSEVRASARRFGWGVEISGDHIEFTFKRGGRVIERVSL